MMVNMPAHQKQSFSRVLVLEILINLLRVITLWITLKCYLFNYLLFQIKVMQSTLENGNKER